MENENRFGDTETRVAEKLCAILSGQEICERMEVEITLCCKEDKGVPAVDFQLAIVASILRRLWKTTFEELLVDVLANLISFGVGDDDDVDALKGPGGRDKRLKDLAAGILGSLSRGVQRAFGAQEAAAFRMALVQLHRVGAASVGGTVVYLDPEIFRILQLGVRDLEFWQSQRVDRNAEELTELIELWLTDRTIRKDEAGRASWMVDFSDVLQDDQGAISTLIADTWAYRAFAIGTLIGAESRGIQFLYAQAVLDSRTTPFCRWVNGRIIGIEDAREQVENYYEAIESGNPDLAIQIWPFLSGEATKEGATGAFEKFFSNAGLPPYHQKCRTRAIAR